MTFTNNHGILLINKSEGKTSFSLVSLLRKITKEKKIGHAGTLDPFAKGLMVLLIGKKYTKMSNNFLNSDKEYFAKLHLGYITKSYDREEEKDFISDKIPSLEEVKKALEKFQGRIFQTPPMYSAKKVNGQKLCDLARKNIVIPRESVIIELTTKLISYNYPNLELQIKCSKGTYIRSIANDLGQILTCGAYLDSLTRTRSGNFHLKDAIDHEKLNESVNLKPYLLQC